MTPDQKQQALQMLRRFERAVPMTRQADNAAVAMATLLQDLIEQQEARTPIKELLAQYAAEGCDFSDLRWLRGTARRLATTMPDSQARCILFALAEQLESVPVLTVECEPGYWSGGHYHEGTKPYIAPAKVWELPIGTKLNAAIDAAIAAEKGGQQ